MEKVDLVAHITTAYILESHKTPFPRHLNTIQNASLPSLNPFYFLCGTPHTTIFKYFAGILQCYARIPNFLHSVHEATDLGAVFAGAELCVKGALEQPVEEGVVGDGKERVSGGEHGLEEGDCCGEEERAGGEGSYEVGADEGGEREG